MLAVDEAAADVDRRTDKSLDAQCIESDAPHRPCRQSNPQPHFVKLHVLGRNMMDMAFRYCQLREY
jgi:hypothetical protein